MLNQVSVIEGETGEETCHEWDPGTWRGLSDG